MAQANEQKPTKQEQVIFYAPHNREMAIYANEIQMEERYPDGRLKKPPKCITFVNHFFNTSDATEITFLKNHAEFKNGRMTVIAPEAMSGILEHHSKVYGRSQEELKDEIKYTVASDS